MPPSHSPESRQDRLTKQWVTFAPSRSARPKQTTDDAHDPDDDRPVEGCPFCPGHEEMLPSILWELDDAATLPWRTRVVPNKFSAYEPDRAPYHQSCGLYHSRASRGHQEVIIETPYHYQSLAQMPLAHVDAVLQTYLERYRILRADENDVIPFLFRNHGASAGASIAHPHSQLIGIDFSPPQIEREERAARAWYDDTGQCPYCTMIEDELDAETRLVWTSDAFVAFVPFAAQVPFEMWILPREHEPEFGRLSPPDRQELARALHAALNRLHSGLGDPDYNFFVRTALAHEPEAPYLHWSLRIRPRTTVQAGFEQSTGVQVNPSIPERDAALLRAEG